MNVKLPHRVGRRRGSIDDHDTRCSWSRRSCFLSVVHFPTLISLVSHIAADNQDADGEDTRADGVNKGKPPIFRSNHFVDLLFCNGEKLQISQSGPGDSIVGKLKEFDRNLFDVHEVGDLQLVPLPFKVEDARDGSIGGDTMIHKLSFTSGGDVDLVMPLGKVSLGGLSILTFDGNGQGLGQVDKDLMLFQLINSLGDWSNFKLAQSLSGLELLAVQ